MKNLLTVALAALACVCFAGETKLKVSGTSGLRGTGTLVSKIQKDGSKYVQLTLELRSQDGQIVTIIQESVYDKLGFPVRKLQSTTSPGGTKQTIIATFDSTGVNLEIRSDGEKGTGRVERPIGKPVAAKSEFWFIRDQIPAGGRTTYYRFDLQTKTWVETVVVYVGDRTITVNGEQLKTHLVTYGDTKAWLDENGDPVRVEMPDSGIVLERVD